MPTTLPLRFRLLDIVRIVSILALTLAYAAALEACGADPNPGSTPSEPVQDGQPPGLPELGPDASQPPDGSTAAGFAWNLPEGFRRPPVPSDNPMTPAKVELGRHLFYDKRLSDNRTFACASCHQQSLAFTDGRATGLGSTGQSHTRGSMSLTNVGYAMTLTWANPTVTQLESQASTPIFGTMPVELGMSSEDEVEARLRDVPRYAALFAAAFPDDTQPIVMRNVLRALAAFERTLISGNSAYDRYFFGGDTSAMSDSALRGMSFVTTNNDHRFECNHCHGGFNFSDQTTYEGAPLANPAFHQTGLYDVDGKGGYPAPNTGVFSLTGRPADMGLFKAPTLRNIALTAPYMHDGSIATLSEVLDHYSKGGRAHDSAQTDKLLKAFPITEDEKRDIIAFLESLTDTDFTTNPEFADPWPTEDDSATN